MAISIGDRKLIKMAIHRIGLKYNLTDKIIQQIVDSPYEFAYTILKEIEVDEIKTEEELDDLKTNFNFKALGKLYIAYPLVQRRENQIKRIINLNNNKKWKK